MEREKHIGFLPSPAPPPFLEAGNGTRDLGRSLTGIEPAALVYKRILQAAEPGRPEKEQHIFPSLLPHRKFRPSEQKCVYPSLHFSPLSSVEQPPSLHIVKAQEIIVT